MVGQVLGHVVSAELGAVGGMPNRQLGERRGRHRYD